MITETDAVVVSGVLTALLAILHLSAPRLRRLPGLPERWTVSFGGGVAVAYVFLHLLPELEQHGETLGSALERLEPVEPVAPLVELSEWTVALLGLVVYLGLELRATRIAAASTDTEGSFFRLHLASYAVYNVLIVFALLSGLEGGWGFALVFTFAMGLHFALNDRALEEHHRERFDHRGRFILAGALLAGWILAVLGGENRPLVLGFTSAFLAGALLLNVFKEEVHVDRQTSFPAFLVGSGLGIALLFLVTLTEG